MKKERMIFADVLRVIAIFFVVLVHVSSVGISDYDMGTLTWGTSVALNTISHWPVPVFLMISGMLFLAPEREVSLKRLIGRNIPKIVLCIVVWGFLYSLLDQYIWSSLSLKSIAIAVYGIVTGNTGYHLWFLYALLVLYVSVPVLRILTTHATKQQLEYALGLWFALPVCVGTANDLASEVMGIERFLPYETMVIGVYAGYFLLGYYLHKYSLSDKAVYILKALALGFVVLMPTVNVLLSMKLQVKMLSSLCSRMSIGSCVIATAVFVLAKRKITDKAPKLWRSCAALGEHVFGVYLVHVFFISLLFRLMGIQYDIIWPPIGIPLFSALVFIISLAVSFVLSKIPCMKKIV